MRILSTNPANVPRHRLNDTDFASNRDELLRRLRQNSYGALIVTDVPDATAAQVLDWVRNAGWKTPVIFVGPTPPGPEVFAVLAPAEAPPEKVETCIVRIIAQDSHNGDGGFIGVQELINLTKEMVQGITVSAASSEATRRSIDDMRIQMREDMRELNGKIDEFRNYADKQRDAILSKIGEGPLGKIHEALKWAADHPVTAVTAFVAMLILVASIVIGINALQPNKVEMIRDWSQKGGQH